MRYIYDILKANKYSILLIYFYMFMAQLIFLAEPYILGKSIDGLLEGDYFWIFVFLLLEITGIAFMYKRMIFDTKIFLKIYNQIVYEYLKKDKDSDASSKIARTGMAQNIVNFLENDLHYYLATFIQIVGSLFFIFNQHCATGFVVVFFFAPMILISLKFYKLIEKGTRLGNDLYETRFTSIGSDDFSLIECYHERRKRILTYSSTIQGKNWASINFSKTIFLIMCLIIFTHDNIGLTQGQAVSMYSYINNFLLSLVSIPIGMEIYSRIKDILKRIT